MPTSPSLCLTGSCTIADVSPQHDRVTAAVTTGQDAVVLDLSGLDRADVTLVQLLLAAQAEAARRARGFAVTAWSPAAKDAFARAGLPAIDFAPLSRLGA